MTQFTEQMAVRFDADTLAAMRADAKTHERTIAQTVRLAVREYLTRQDEA